MISLSLFITFPKKLNTLNIIQGKKKQLRILKVDLVYMKICQISTTPRNCGFRLLFRVFFLAQKFSFLKGLCIQTTSRVKVHMKRIATIAQEE